MIFDEMFNSQGVIPPIYDNNGASANRSPFKISIFDFCSIFSVSADRIQILKGFLEYRRSLYKQGVISGFQWVDGSFVEHSELVRGRSPNDIDVVTFANIEHDQVTNKNWVSEFSKLIDPEYTKPNFMVDAYFFQLGVPCDASTVKQISYWSNLFSHQRDTMTYKGFFQIDLDENDSREIDAFLDQKILECSNQRDI